MLFWICLDNLYSQEGFDRLQLDTVVLKKGYILSINNRSYIVHSDTTLYIAKGVPYKIYRSREDIFFNKLDSSSNKNKFTRGLRKLLLANPPSTGSSLLSPNSTENVDINFVPYKNRIIRNISFKQLNVFGPTITDTTLEANTWLEKTVNRLHFNTKTYLLKNNLLIKKGDLVDPIKIADNERILRDLPFLEDAKIFIKDIDHFNDSVDVVILVKDVWSKAFDLKIENVYSGNFEFWDRNIMGLGHENLNSIYWNRKYRPSLGYEGLYRINNIGGSFIKSDIIYHDNANKRSFGVNLERNFFTPNVKYAGGGSFIKYTGIDAIQYSDSVALKPVEYIMGDVWCGRSFALKGSNLLSRARNNLTATFRITNYFFSQRPDVTENTLYNYFNRTLYLGALSFTRQSFLKSNLIYNYGKTEDIPSGLEARFTYGYEKNEFSNRHYLGVKFSLAKYLGNLGYLYYNVEHGGFLHNNKIEQGFVEGKIGHFTPLYTYKKFKFRHFVDADYLIGINRFKNEYLTINKDYGLQGFLNDSIHGTHRFNLHLESVCFSPWYIFEFRFVFFAYAEFSWLGDHQFAFANKEYTGLGLGIRIRNQRLTFNTIELKFTLYPNKPSYTNSTLLHISGEKSPSFDRFYPKAPDIPVFR